jgi:TolB-like protein
VKRQQYDRFLLFLFDGKKIFSRLFLSFTALIFLLLLLPGCRSIGPPREEEDSLLIVVDAIPRGAIIETEKLSFSGPKDFNMTIRRKNFSVHYKPMPSGEYTYIDPGTQAKVTFTLSADTVFLFPKKVVMDDKGEIILTHVTPQDQKRVSEDIADFIGFSEWFGKYFQGFGPYRPRFVLDKERYDFEIISRPEGAEVLIDGQNWGNAPITADLEPGKHLVRLEMEGFNPAQTFIDVTGPGKAEISLTRPTEKVSEEETEAERAADITQDKYSLLISPLNNIGDKDFDYLRSVFSDVIASVLYKKDNIQVILESDASDESEMTNSSTTGYTVEGRPDFSRAEELGAELMVSGRFKAEEEDLFVHASLYDVRTGQVKTSIMYTGEAGLAMFESIDGMTEQFMENITRVLPAVGKEVIEEKQEINREIISYEKKVSVKEIIDQRLSWKNSISGGVTWGGGFEQIVISGNTFDYNTSRTDGPSLGLLATYDRELFKPVSLAVRGGVIFSEASDAFLGTDTATWEVPIYAGPSLSFYGKTLDLNLGILGLFKFVDGFDYWDYDFAQYEEIGPFLTLGASIEAGIKWYLNKRLSTTPSFIHFGMLLDPLSWRIDIETENDPVMVPFYGTFYIGFGVRIQ